MSKLTYYCDVVEFPRLNKPEVWSEIDETKKTMFKSYPDFEFIPGTKGDEEPIRYGDFVLDIDTKEQAIDDAKRIIAHFQEQYSVDPDEWQIFLSGKKGVHLILSDKIFDIESGHKLLTLGYKRLAKDIEGELGISLDLSMFNRGTGKPFRQANVLRQDTKTYKVQINFDELEEITDDYVELCSQPREIWTPEVKKNDILSKILKQYLDILEKDDFKAIPLTQEQIESLKEAPSCMKFLSRLEDQIEGNGSTFNDIAIQLTAYALSAGFDEQRFLSACSSFIYNYPSSSLTTHKKRLDNVVNRYRNMATIGSYTHSCGGVMALGIKGVWDCRSCHYKKLEHTEKICSIEDLSDVSENKSTIFPCHLIENRGLISSGIRGIQDWSGNKILPYNICTCLIHLSTALAGKIRYKTCHPSFLFVKLGDTSTGKTDSDSAIAERISNYVGCYEEKKYPDGTKENVNLFYGGTKIVSGPGFLRSLQKQPTSMLMLDEISDFFDRNKNNYDALSTSKIKEVLEVSTSPGRKKVSTYSDTGKNIVIEYPVLNLIGNATIKNIFNSIDLKDFNSGLVQRFEFFCYDGDILYRDAPEEYSAHGDIFLNALCEIKTMQKPKGTYCLLTDSAVDIGMTYEAEQYMKDQSIKIIDAANQTDDDGKKGIISRQYHSIIKFALLHLGATRPTFDIFKPIELSDLEWGKGISDILTDWKINVLAKNVSSGEFDNLCNLFLEAAKSAVKTGNKPTLKLIVNRRPVLGNVVPRKMDEITTVLEARELIVIKHEKKKLYYPTKKQNV